jgi:phenylpropionate dioxygenase-like ring-hydroxylating dioxygenase large terminal subunit
METAIHTAGTASGRGDMANAATPFIHNAWYVIALAGEVGRTPLARTVLGHSIVLFRTTSAAVVALQNRCCHRSFPLAHGRVEQDTIVCGYHGLRYDPTGRCIEIPMQKTVPAAVRVRAFRTLERGPFIWIWPGVSEQADESTLPHQDWMDHPHWDTVWGYLHVKGSYVHLHENLLDLSHLSFLHANTFGTPEYAAVPVETRIEGTDIQAWRHVPCKLPPIYAQPLGWSGANATRSSGSQFVAPGLHINTGIFRNLDDPGLTGNPPPTVKVAQLITPETSHTTHYWTLLARNFVRGKPEISSFMLEQQLAAFREDVFAIERISELQQLEAGLSFQEISLPTDKAGVIMRRRLQQLADLEQPIPSP